MWEYLETALIIIALLFCSGAFVAQLSGDVPAPETPTQDSALNLVQQQARQNADDPTSPQPIRLGLELLVYTSLAWLIWRRRHEALNTLLETKLLWGLIALCFLSVFWSEQEMFALRRCLFMTATSGLGLYLAIEFSPRRSLRLLTFSILLCAIFSCIAVIVAPDQGIDPTFTNGAWRGIFIQKNTLGRLMVLGVVVSSIAAIDAKGRKVRWVYAGGALLCAALIGLSRSATSALMLPVIGLLLLFFRRIQSRSILRTAIAASPIVIGVIALTFLIVQPSEILEALGRDATLSGRSDIWSAVVPKILLHPWLGYGYASFWLGFQGSASADIWAMLHWHVPHSHNGFLDLVEQLGIIGSVLFFAGYLFAFWRAIRWSRINRTVLGLWPLAFLLFTFLFNMTEGFLLKQDNLFWALYVFTYVLVVVRTNHPRLKTKSVPRTSTVVIPTSGKTSEVHA